MLDCSAFRPLRTFVQRSSSPHTAISPKLSNLIVPLHLRSPPARPQARNIVSHSSDIRDPKGNDHRHHRYHSSSFIVTGRYWSRCE
ncbi:hypothetical protein M407DRAFT_95184 [Tulasnella calospora MUT 4182]|uniref:Uncharacterized protein n=1 Tax=Tulasnella calospora MUT 4182 TaxID=1051891 RepID=A0A0C3QFR7_9AGAM|nr:hypothetical protein M407DRAFT_95184 [Tulasnella calospora MUT 4182]